ncbi:MAG: glycosyltransferase family 4 protein [Candidatus Buchananbacteria bacterium]
MAQKTKILYLITQSEWGGAGRYVFDLAGNLPKDQYEVAVAAGGNEELFESLKKIAITTYQLKNLVRQISAIDDIKAYSEIKKLVKKVNPDILHLNSSKAGVIGAIAGRHAKVKKIVYTAHGFVFNEPMPGWKKIIYLLAEKFSAKYKDAIICVSEFDRQTAIKNKIASETKLVTVNNGVGPIDFIDSKTAREKLNLPPDKIVIGTIANFYETKGLVYLIKAAKLITEKFPDVIFRLIGFGQLENDLKAEIQRLNLSDRFFIGKVENGKNYLKAFDYYILSSVKEGFPYAILEAMQTGLPIVATNVGGIPEMISDKTNGLLVKSADPRALAQALTSLLQDKNLAAQLGNQAKLDVEKKFSLQKMLAETQKVYFQK